MATNTASPGMPRIERAIAAPPGRAAIGAVRVFTRLVGRILETRRYRRADEVEGALVNLEPLLHLLVVTHAVEDRPVELVMPDLCVPIRFIYAYPANEDITLPPVEAFGPLGPDIEIEVRLPLTGEAAALGREDITAKTQSVPFLRLTLVPYDQQPTETPSLQTDEAAGGVPPESSPTTCPAVSADDAQGKGDQPCR